MLFDENHDLDDYLLPDDQTMEELDGGEDDAVNHGRNASMGMFDDNPDGASAWMERVSSRFTRF